MNEKIIDIGKVSKQDYTKAWQVIVEFDEMPNLKPGKCVIKQ